VIQAALHLTAAVLLAFVIGETTTITLVLALFLALAPDIDTPKSLIGSLLKPISVPLERRFGHRTATHSLLALALVAGVAYLLFPRSWMVLAAAYGSHLVLDLLIGVQGIMLLWPTGDFLTLTGWRDDGPAPRLLLSLLLPAAVIAAMWPQLGPVLNAPIHAAVAVANPISTPTPKPTERPSIHLSFELPAGVGLSALRVQKGDVIAEDQVLAQWERPAPTPWPTPTAPATPPPPAALPITGADQAAARGVAEAQAALDALTTAQAAARAALLADQQRELADQQRMLAEAQRQLGQLQPRHERDQAEAQHTVYTAHQALRDAQAAAALPSSAEKPEAAAAEAQRAAERIHEAEAKLRSALDAQDHMRTEQGIERDQAEAAVKQVQADLDALPDQQRQALAKLDADQQAARILATSRVESARGQVADAQRATERDTTIAAATTTAAAVTWQAQVTATAQAHQAAVTATAQAQPTPNPTSVISRASGRVLHVSAQEQDGRLVVTLEVAP